MKLYIDTSSRSKVIVGIDAKRYVRQVTNVKAQAILQLIEDVLEKSKITPKSLDSIEIFTGPGSFTGLRVGVAVANTMAWVLNIPINGKNPKKMKFVDIKYS